MVNNKATVFVIPRQLLILATFNYYVLCVRHGARCEGYCDERDSTNTGLSLKEFTVYQKYVYQSTHYKSDGCNKRGNMICRENI